MMTHRLPIAAFAAASALAASLLTAMPAHAASAEADDIVQTLEAVPTEVPLLQDVVTHASTDLVPPGATSSDASAIRDVGAVEVSAAGEDPLAVDLLAADHATAVSVSSDGVEVIDNGDGSSTVPLAREDGSLQVVFVIESVDAPSTYTIDVDLPDGVVLTHDEGGSLLATDDDGLLALGVAPAWAFDAAGVAVPTSYEVDGEEITQVVDHASGDYQYPITADPYLGIRLFDPMRVNRNGTYLGQNVYSGQLTAWGVSMGLSPLGVQIMSTYGLTEFTNQWAAVAGSRSLQQQYLCHAIWGRAILGAGFNWDLEAARPTNSNHANVFAHRCNW